MTGLLTRKGDVYKEVAYGGSPWFPLKDGGQSVVTVALSRFFFLMEMLTTGRVALTLGELYPS